MFRMSAVARFRARCSVRRSPFGATVDPLDRFVCVASNGSFRAIQDKVKTCA